MLKKLRIFTIMENIKKIKKIRNKKIKNHKFIENY